MPQDAAASEAPGPAPTRRHPGARAPAARLGTPPRPALRTPGAAAEGRAHPHPGQPRPAPAQRLCCPSRGRPVLARKAAGPAARKASGWDAPNPSLLRCPRLGSRRPPGSHSVRVPASHLSVFPEPGTPRLAPWQGREGSEARAVKKPPNLPAISQLPGPEQTIWPRDADLVGTRWLEK